MAGQGDAGAKPSTDSSPSTSGASSSSASPFQGPVRGPRVFYSSTLDATTRMLDYSLRRDPTVKYLVNALAQQGCPVTRSFFRVEDCSENASGGFLPGTGVILCANHLGYQDEVNTILAHELVHAYDYCRVKNMDWHNLRHHACSEIRAANLSGQCHLNRELHYKTTDFIFREGHKVCVKRKAQLSVAMNPTLTQQLTDSHSEQERATEQGRQTATVPVPPTTSNEAAPLPPVDTSAVSEVARALVEEVWEPCYRDTAPFTGIP